jgi:hypothetical protein
MSRRYTPAPREQYALFDATAPLRQIRHMDDLPETAHALIEVIGLQATIDLVAAHGGNDVKVPALVDGTSRAWAMLEETIGREAATKLVNSHFKDTPVYVPMCAAALRAERNRDIVRRLGTGEEFDAVRRLHRVSRSYLYRLLNKYGT